MDKTTKQILTVYCKRGFKLFPVRKVTKRPAIKDNLKKASSDIDQLIKWAEKFPECNWGISLAQSGLVALDVDHKYGGMEAWQGLISDPKKGDPDTLKAKSGSGALHYVFKANPELRYRGKIQDGLDIKYNGYILVYPSIHEDTGNLYKWINWNERSKKIAEPPEWLLNLIKKDSRTGKNSPVYKFGHDYLSKLVEELKNHELSYQEWVQAGMAIHSADDSPEGLALFLELTKGPAYQEGDLEKAQEKWDGFTHKNDGVTQNTLSYLIYVKGGVVPNPHFQEDIELFKRQKLEKFEAEKEKYPGFYKAYNRLICWKHSGIVTEFNKMGYSFLKDGSMTPFLKVFKDDEGELRIQKMTEKGFALETAPYQYARINELAMDVRPSMSPAYREWLESTDKKTYTDIVFKPVAKKSELNLWTPIYFEPDFKADCFEILDMITRSLCNGDTKKAEWILDWLAHIVQRPEEKATVVPVFISDQGAGKGLLMDHIMGRILGNRYTAVSSSSELMAKFNAKLSKKFLTFIDEATWRGDHKEDGILKRFTASPTMTIEEKFGASYDMENYSRYCIASNNPEAVAVEKGNRRYVIIESNNQLADKTEYFRPLADKIRNTHKTKIVQAFYAHLLARDISKFNPYKILEDNTDGRTAKIKTAGVVAQFWEDFLFENPRSGVFDSRGLNMIRVWDEFCDFRQQINAYERGISASGFWIKTRSIVNSLPDRVRKRVSGTGERPRYLEITPKWLANEFTRALRITIPSDFEDRNFYDFDEIDENGNDYAQW